MHIHAQSRAERSQVEQSSVEERRHLLTVTASSDFERTAASKARLSRDIERTVAAKACAVLAAAGNGVWPHSMN